MSKVLLLLLALVLLAPGVHAGEGHVTPFGISCPPCDTYGYCRKQLTCTEAVQNLEAYYAQKGLRVSIVRQFGRFLETNTYKRDGRREDHRGPLDRKNQADAADTVSIKRIQRPVYETPVGTFGPFTSRITRKKFQSTQNTSEKLKNSYGIPIRK